MAVITEVRKEKAEKKKPLNAQIKRLTVYAEEKNAAKTIMEGKEDIAGTCKTAYMEILFKKGEGREVKPYDKVHFVAEF